MSEDKRDDNSTDDEVTVVRAETDYPMIEIRSGGEGPAQSAAASEPESASHSEATEALSEEASGDGIGMVIHRGDPYPRATAASAGRVDESAVSESRTVTDASTIDTPTTEASAIEPSTEPETGKAGRKAAKRKLFGKGTKLDDDASTGDAAPASTDAVAVSTSSDGSSTDETDGDESSSRWLGKRAGAAALLTLGLGGLAAFFAIHPGADATTENVAFENGAQTSTLMTQAIERACAPFTFDYRTLEKDLNAAAMQFTGQALTEFDKYVQTTTKSAAEQSKTSSDCQADQVAISSMTNTEATVVSQLIVSTTQNGIPMASDTPRVQYRLEKHGSQWLIAEVGTF